MLDVAEPSQNHSLSFLPSLPLSLHVYIRANINVHIHADAHGCICVKKHNLLFFLLRYSFFPSWSSPGKLGWLTSEPQGSTCLNLPSARTTSMCHHVKILLLPLTPTTLLRSVLARQIFYWLSHPPQPLLFSK